LLLGLMILLSLLVSAQGVVCFFLLACGLAMVHSLLSGPGRTLEDYALIVPHWIDRLAAKAKAPDGRLVLGILFVAAAVFLAPHILFGLGGAAALLASLRLLHALERPATRLWGWGDALGRSWARWVRERLGAAPAAVLAALSAAPTVWLLAGVVVAPRTGAWRYGQIGVTAAALLALMAWLLRPVGRAPTAGPVQESLALGRRTLWVSTVAISLALLVTGIQVTRRLGIPFLTGRLEWNGIWLGLAPAAALWIWWRGYHKRMGPVAPADTGEPLAERESWKASTLAAAAAALLVFLQERALVLDKPGVGAAGVSLVLAGLTVVWTAAAWLLLHSGRTDDSVPVPEWAMVQALVLLSSMVCFLGVFLGGVWGALLAIVPVLRFWQEAARLMRRSRAPASDAGPQA